jgi:hypothetical protein
VAAERSGLLSLRLASLFALAGVLFSVGVHAAAASTRAANATPVVAVDPNTLGKASADAVAIVSWISPGTYQLDVQNTSGIGYIDTFTWHAPINLTITAVTKSVGGKCTLVGGDIQCSGKVAPPKCTCLPGGDLVVTFTANGLEPSFANGYWTYYGIVGAYLQIQQMTPVPYHIPSALPSFTDLPVCKKGQKSTKASPCL